MKFFRLAPILLAFLGSAAAADHPGYVYPEKTTLVNATLPESAVTQLFVLEDERLECLDRTGSLAVLVNDDRARIVELATQRQIFAWETEQLSHGRPWVAAFSLDNRLVALARLGAPGLRIVDTRTGRVVDQDKRLVVNQMTYTKHGLAVVVGKKLLLYSRGKRGPLRPLLPPEFLQEPERGWKLMDGLQYSIQKDQIGYRLVGDLDTLVDLELDPKNGSIRVGEITGTTADNQGDESWGPYNTVHGSRGWSLPGDGSSSISVAEGLHSGQELVTTRRFDASFTATANNALAVYAEHINREEMRDHVEPEMDIFEVRDLQSGKVMRVQDSPAHSWFQLSSEGNRLIVNEGGVLWSWNLDALVPSTAPGAKKHARSATPDSVVALLESYAQVHPSAVGPCGAALAAVGGGLP